MILVDKLLGSTDGNGVKVKYKIEELLCFTQVSGVIGESRAKVELFKVLNSNIRFINNPDVKRSFVWGSTPQGADFWKDIVSKTKKL